MLNCVGGIHRRCSAATTRSANVVPSAGALATPNVGWADSITPGRTSLSISAIRLATAVAAVDSVCVRTTTNSVSEDPEENVGPTQYPFDC